MTALPSERDRIQQFYRDVLGCHVSHFSKSDSIHLGSGFFISVFYRETAAPEPRLQKSIWLELRTNNPGKLKNKILEFGGITTLEPPGDREHFHFQAPGGQVFRIVADTENLSAIEQ
jgi:catechol 2,3-dioxygenase-like lactoylglutathione lyase family enzyme